MDTVARIHGAVGRLNFYREVLCVLDEAGVISAQHVHVARFNKNTGAPVFQDRHGTVMLHGAPLAELHVKERKDDVLTAKLLQVLPGPFVRSQLIGRGAIRQTAAYHEVHKPLGILDIIAAPVSTPSDLYVFAWLRDKFYSEKDRRVAALLRDQIKVAMRNHQALLHTEESGRMLRQTAGQSLILGVRSNGSIADWSPEVAEWLLPGAASLSLRPPDDLADWVRRCVQHYPWLSPRESTMNYTGRPDAPSIHIHFLGRRDGRHEVLFQQAREVPPCYGLTEREKDVLRWLCQGKRNEEIGMIFGISAFTVRNHVEKILQKLGAENRGAAAAMAHGWFR